MQRTHVPHPSSTGSPTGRSAVVTTHPITKKLPAPGTRMFAFFPYQPIPASHATSRSTIELSSAKTTARCPSARRRAATCLSDVFRSA